MKKHFILFTILSLAIVLGCKKDDESLTMNEDPQTENNVLIETEIDVILPDELKNESINISISNEELEPNGNLSVEFSSEIKEFVFVTNKQNEILLASPLKSGKTEVTSTTMAETFISMLPWSGYLSNTQLKNVIAEIKGYDEFNQLVSQIEQDVKQNESSLNDEICITLINQINQKIFSNQANKSQKTTKSARIPDVDFLVEPKLSYSNNKMTIRNDGQTTATWGVQFLNSDGNPVSDYLMLKGNEASLPDLSSIWNFFVNEEPINLIKESAPIVYDITSGAKYSIDFKSPTSSTILEGKLATNTALYNVYYNYSVFLDAFGIKLPEMPTLNPSDFLNLKGCTKDLFSTTFDKSIEALSKDELDDDFIIESVKSIFNESTDAIANCTEIGGKISNSNYVKHISKFLDVYSKVEGAFKIGKFIGDMAVLSDINICRHFIQDNMYSCFDLEKNTSSNVETEVYCPETEVELSIKTVLEEIFPNENTYPIGLEITWEYEDQNNENTTSKSTVNSQGTSSFIYTTNEKENQKVVAKIKTDDLVSFSIEFDLKVDREKIECIENPFIGNWTAVSFNGGNSMGELQKSGFISECNVYTEQWTVNSASANITESNISISISQRTGNSGYESSGGVVDCESINIEFENDNFSINDSYTIKNDGINADLDTEIDCEGEGNNISTLSISGNKLTFKYCELTLTFEK
jgi:hypothetical protein